MTDKKVLDKISNISSKGVLTNKGVVYREIRQKKQRFPKLISFIVVGCVFAISSSAVHTILTNPFNKGIEFAGGLVVEIQCKDCDTGTINKNIEKSINSTPTIQKSGDNLIIKTTTTSDYDKVIEKIKTSINNKDAKIVSTDFVSPQMTKTFLEDSFSACIFALVCIGLYMIIRFNWRFALAGIIALSFDVLMAICFINIKSVEFCLLTLTALLTIIGYCINDKIVVFDRIRESLKFEKDKSVAENVKSSLKGVLIRSVLTSMTTIIIALSLLFFGDRFVYEFGLVVIFGIIVGTISSLTFAPSLLMLFGIKHMQNQTIEKTPMFYAS